MSVGYLRGKPWSDQCKGYTLPAPQIPEDSTNMNSHLKHTRSTLNQVSTQLRTHKQLHSALPQLLPICILHIQRWQRLSAFICQDGLGKKNAKHPKQQFYPCVKCKANLTVVCDSGAVEFCPQRPGAMPNSTWNSLTQKPL